MKHCSKCFEVLPLKVEYFYRQRNGEMGLASECKECRKDYKKGHYKENKDKYNQARKEYYRKNKEKEIRQVITYRENNKDKLRRYWADYYQENKNQYKKHMTIYKKNNPGRFKEYSKRGNHKRRHREQKTKFDFTTEQWQQCLTHFNYSCAYCNEYENLEQEHVIPVSRGGHYTADNIIPACKRCNSSKNNKIMQDWFISRETYSLERMVKILNYIHSFKEYKEA